MEDTSCECAAQHEVEKQIILLKLLNQCHELVYGGSVEVSDAVVVSRKALNELTRIMGDYAILTVNMEDYQRE